jgi:thioredoxin reductase (NADPH)
LRINKHLCKKDDQFFSREGNMKIYDVVIIGAGPAGMTAAIYAVRASMSVLILDRLAPGGQMVNTNEIENYTGVGKINGAELSMQMYEHTQALGAEFDYKTVIDIKDEGEKKILLCEEDNSAIEARTVIIATGTIPRRLDIPGEDNFAGSGISWCAICDGAQYRSKDVVVVGGGQLCRGGVCLPRRNHHIAHHSHHV